MVLGKATHTHSSTVHGREVTARSACGWRRSKRTRVNLGQAARRSLIGAFSVGCHGGLKKNCSPCIFHGFLPHLFCMNLDPETALNLIEDMASEAERRFWDQHIQGCGECAVELEDWCAFIGWVRRSHLLSTPEEVLASAKRIFPIHHAKVRSDAA